MNLFSPISQLQESCVELVQHLHEKCIEWEQGEDSLAIDDRDSRIALEVLLT